jgi:hypothetical protein
MKTGIPIAVRTVEHRTRDTEGRRLGHVGYVQRRSNEKMARFGGKRFAAWAQLTRDGSAAGSPERFETFDTAAEARARATYAAGCTP